MSEDVVNAKQAALTDKLYPHIRGMVNLFNAEIAQRDDSVDKEAYVLAIVERILSADTALEVFEAAEAGTMTGQDFTNTPFYLKLEDISFAQSKYNDTSFPYYARLQVRVISSGEVLPISCGGMTFVFAIAQLRELARQGKIDLFDGDDGASLVIEEVHTESGKIALRLAPAEK